MKAVIPVAGVGTRLRPHTYTQPKALILVAGKPILAFIIDELRNSGINDFIFIIGYLGEKVEHFVKNRYPDLNASFIHQTSRKGIGHAIFLAREEIGNDEIFIALGDTIFEVDLKSVFDSPHSSLGVKKVKDPRQFGVAETDESNQISRVVEKPEIPKSNLALVGLYKIKESKQLLDALDYNIKNKIKTKGEYQLTDGLMKMLENGVKITTFQVDSWFDCGKKEVLLDTNAILLKKFGFASKEVPFYENTVVVHPVSIAQDCVIRNSIIGPNVTIGENTTVEHSIVKNSLIGNFTRIENALLHDSVVGSDGYIHGISQSLNIGDNTEIDFS